MLNYFIQVMKKYAVFSGRARRAEYWYFFLMNFIIGFIIGFVGGISGASSDTTDTIVLVYQVVILIPSIAVAIRRVHDTDHSGWFVLVPIYNLYLMVKKGTEGDNRFGADPLLAATENPSSATV